MLSLYTSGYNYSRRRCESIVEWFCTKYLKRYKIEIEVLHRGLLREGACGYCSIQDLDSRPRSFLIELHTGLDVESYIKTILHELWHVNQHVKGALRDKRGKRYWRGVDHSTTDYSDQPWEQQAFIMENVLYQEYLTECQ